MIETMNNSKTLVVICKKEPFDVYIDRSSGTTYLK